MDMQTQSKVKVPQDESEWGRKTRSLQSPLSAVWLKRIKAPSSARPPPVRRAVSRGQAGQAGLQDLAEADVPDRLALWAPSRRSPKSPISRERVRLLALPSW